MIIPTFQSAQYVTKEGFLTAQMQLFNDELNNVLRNGLSDNGWTFPVITAANLTKLETQPAIDRMPNGTLWVVINTDPPSLVPEVVIKLDDGTGTQTSALYKLTKTAYP